jgi:phosphonate transport system substrate-binding protein
MLQYGHIESEIEVLLIVRKIIIMVFISIFLVSCSSQQDGGITLRATENEMVVPDHLEENALRVAFASVVSPQQTRKKYNLLIDYLEDKLDKPIVIVQKQTYDEVNQMIKLGEVDLAFICSLSYVIGKEQNYLEGLVAPKINDKSQYRSYIIAHKNSEIESFEDLEGKRFAFVDPYSYSGRLAVLDLLNARGLTTEFFEEIFYTYSHDYSVSAVARGAVEAAAVDSILFDQLVELDNEDAKLIKIIEYGSYAGTPPIVVSNKIDEDLKHNIKNALLFLKDDPIGNDILHELGIDEYIIIDEKRYLPIVNTLHLLGESNEKN